jgi:hypothetical protein
MKRSNWVLLILLAVVSLALAVACGSSSSTSGASSSQPVESVWTDPTTGLMWQNGSAVGSNVYTWAGAKDYCTELTWAGYNGWRLPAISELRSLIRGCAATETGGPCGVTDLCWASSCDDAACHGCSEETGGPGLSGAYWPPQIADIPNYYWSSTTVADYDIYAWIVGFGDGDVEPNGLHGVSYGSVALCVRP